MVYPGVYSGVHASLGVSPGVYSGVYVSLGVYTRFKGSREPLCTVIPGLKALGSLFRYVTVIPGLKALGSLSLHTVIPGFKGSREPSACLSDINVRLVPAMGPGPAPPAIPVSLLVDSSRSMRREINVRLVPAMGPGPPL